MKKLLMVSNVDWFFISHRLCIAIQAKKQGWDVYVAAENTGRRNEIEKEGIIFIDFPFSRSSVNPFNEIQTIINFRKLYLKIKPDIVHHITLKPVIYGTAVAKSLKIKGVVNAISGLGYNFTNDRKSIIKSMMIFLMKYGFKRNRVSIIFQNQQDKLELENLKVIHRSNILNFIKGSGVDLIDFSQASFPAFDKIIFLLPIRMLWDKGVLELKKATDILKENYDNKIQFVLSGLADEENKAGVSAKFLNEWQDGNYVKWIGYQKNMVEVYKNCHVVVLPSYREGMPKSLIEACAVGRPIITTDAIGCRECVDEGENGLKVPVYSINELATAIKFFVDNQNLIAEMGQKSRKKAENEFDVKNVIEKHLLIYQNLLD